MGKRVSLLVTGILLSNQNLFAHNEPNKITCEKALATTMEHYNKNAVEYAEKQAGFSPKVIKVLNDFLAEIPVGGKILEIGAAHGRDTLYFIERGFKVIAVEPSSGLADILEKRIGYPVDRRTAQKLVYENEIDAVFSMAVLHHIPVEELKLVYQNFANSKKSGKLFHASYVKGVGTPDVAEIDSKGRYWSRVSETSLRKMIAEIPNLEIDEKLTYTDGDDYHGTRAPTTTFGFFNLTVRKVEPTKYNPIRSHF